MPEPCGIPCVRLLTKATQAVPRTSAMRVTRLSRVVTRRNIAGRANPPDPALAPNIDDRRHAGRAATVTPKQQRPAIATGNPDPVNRVRHGDGAGNQHDHAWRGHTRHTARCEKPATPDRQRPAVPVMPDRFLARRHAKLPSRNAIDRSRLWPPVSCNARRQPRPRRQMIRAAAPAPARADIPCRHYSPSPLRCPAQHVPVSPVRLLCQV